MKKVLLFFVITVAFISTIVCGALPAYAQTLVRDTQETIKAKVLEIVDEKIKNIPGTDKPETYQTIRVEILEGNLKNQVRTIENDYIGLKVGDIFYLLHTTNSLDDSEYYTVSDPYRLPWLSFFLALFILCVLIFGGWQGMRGLVALAGSLLAIFYLLLPGIIHGYSPILLSIGISSIIIIVGSYVTHGFNRTTTAAVIGMILTVSVTGALAYAAVYLTQLTGYANEEAIYLNFDTNGGIDFVGLLLGGIMIGLLGVLYDVAISQAISIEELFRIGPHLPRRHLYMRAIRIGREHIGALVNTLAIAYVGASLPLLLLFYTSHADAAVTLNREVFSAEIIRIIIGSIGVVLAVPITTAIAAWILIRRSKTEKMEPSPNDILVGQHILASEKDKVEHFGDSHIHS